MARSTADKRDALLRLRARVLAEQLGVSTEEIAQRWRSGLHHCSRHGWSPDKPCRTCNRERSARTRSEQAAKGRRQ